MIDVLLPILGVLFALKWRQFSTHKFYLYIFGFGVYVFITMLINHREDQLRDYFEIFKLFKFAFVVGLFSLTNPLNFSSRWIPPLFVILVILNLIHFFELFGFNELLKEYYQAGERIDSFGKNSLGFPAFKRLLGTVCNPNNNGLLFSFMLAYFLPSAIKTRSKHTWFFVFLSILMILLSQSRTGLICLAAVISIASFLFLKYQWKRILLLIALAASAYTVSYSLIRLDFQFRKENPSALIDLVEYKKFQESRPENGSESTYLNTFIDGTAFNSNSVQGRISIWKHIWSMVKKKPLFGHGPNKDYFYKNNLYAESQYFSILWRYGFIGLICFLFLLLYLMKIGLKNRDKLSNQTLILGTLTMAIGSLTNNPFDHQTLLFVFAGIIGLAFAENNLIESKNEESIQPNNSL